MTLTSSSNTSTHCRPTKHLYSVVTCSYLTATSSQCIRPKARPKLPINTNLGTSPSTLEPSLHGNTEREPETQEHKGAKSAWMSSSHSIHHQFADAGAAQVRGLSSADYNLTIRQQPQYAKVAIGKEKDRKPIDPPPIIQLQINGVRDQTFLQSPYFFMSANLLKSDGDEIQDAQIANVNTSLAGTLVSSLHRLKDLNNEDVGFFIFFDLSVKITGSYRLQFNLYEMREATSLPDESTLITSADTLSQSVASPPREVCLLKTITSDQFTVHGSRTWPGMLESTALTRNLSEQGVKVRLRKEPRSLLRKRGPASDDYEPKTYRTKMGRSEEAGTQAARRDSTEGIDTRTAASHRMMPPFRGRTASGMTMTSSEGTEFQGTPNPYEHPSQQANDPSFPQRFDTSDAPNTLRGQGSPIQLPSRTRIPNSIPRGPLSHQGSSDLSSASSTTRPEEFGGNMRGRNFGITQLRQANSESSLRSQSRATNLPFNGVPDNPYLTSSNMSNPNRSSFSDFSGTYTHQPPPQTMHPSLQRTPQSYAPSYTSHSHSHSQSSLTSLSPATTRSTPQSYYSFGAGPRDAHTGMGSSAMTSPFESPDATRRDFGAWTGEGGEERGSIPSRGQDPTAVAGYSTSPFYGQRHSTGSSNYGYNNPGRSIPISQAQPQGLGISGVYNPAAGAPTSYMPGQNLMSQQQQNNELLPPLSGSMVAGGLPAVETGQEGEGVTGPTTTAPENLSLGGSAGPGVGDGGDIRRIGW